MNRRLDWTGVNATIRIVKENRESVLNKIRSGQLNAVRVSSSDLADDIIFSMNKNGVLSSLQAVIPDKRKPNSTIPYKLLLALSVAAKMKGKRAMTDIPVAIQDHRLLNELGYNIIGFDDEDKDIVTEGALRSLFKKYEHQSYFTYYNAAVQEQIIPKLGISGTQHIVDCTKICVELSNDRYEESEVAVDSKGKRYRGYKVAAIKTIIGGAGVITDTRFGGMKTHDLPLSEDMIRTTPVLKLGDSLIYDRGFISRTLLNYLKTSRGVDVYVPLKIKMNSYDEAVEIAKKAKRWIVHPNPKRTSQKIAYVPNLGIFWRGDNPSENVDFNACVVWDTEAKDPEDEYFVFITTDLSKTAREIIMTYELRCKIEEVFRQIKDKWKLEDFKSTKIRLITFHIMATLFGYLFFNLFTMLPEGKKYSRKSLPAVLKNYQPKTLPYFVLYVGGEFGILSLTEFNRLYASVEESVRAIIDAVTERGYKAQGLDTS